MIKLLFLNIISYLENCCSRKAPWSIEGCLFLPLHRHLFQTKQPGFYPNWTYTI